MEGSSRLAQSGSETRVFALTARPKATRIVSLTALAVLGLILISSLLSVNTFPIIGNDSVLYIEHSRNLAAGGWVENGYRQFGYPLFLAVSRFVADAVGGEPFLTASVLQRLLLITAALGSWRLWRWWSLPLIAFLLSAHTLVYANFLLIEGLAVPLAALLALPTARFLQRLETEQAGDRRRLALLGLLVVVGVAGLYALRFTYVVFGAVPVILAIRAWKTSHRRLALGVLAATVLLIGVIALSTSFENQREHGEFWPSVSDEPVRYYFAWQQVFTVRPENMGDTALAEFYDDGVVHDFSRGVGDLTPDEEREVYDSEIHAMFEAAGLSLVQTRLQAFLTSLAAGRLDDIGSIVDAAVLVNNEDVEQLIYLNQHAMQNGPQGFSDAYNDGRLAGAIITDQLGWPALIPATRTLVRVLVPLSLLIMTAGLVSRATRWLSLVGLLVVVSFAMGMGWLLADNLRFLMPTSGFGIAVACGVLATLTMDVIRGRRNQSRSDKVVSDQCDRMPAS